jgi:hypothetical protein
MTVRLWSEYARDEWARYAGVSAPWDPRYVDELRPPETDEEPWDILDAAVVGTAWWAAAFGVVVLALTAVLALLGLRSLLGRNGS